MGMANGADRPGEAPGFGRMFEPGRLTLGVFFPIEAFEGDRPTMRHQERLARRAEELGFAALWVRDVPLRDPTFGDVGQVYDPWVYLGWIAAQTSTIALATGSIVLTLRHPLHTAKAAASVDRLSGGRLVLGVASGDRPVEFPAFGVDYDGRDAVFRENLRVIREVLAVEFPRVRSSSGTLSGAVDLIPKPAGRLPILVTGSSRQDLDWIAEHSDGWITYPRPVGRQAELAARWRAAVASAAPGAFKPFAQSLYLDLVEDPGGPPEPLHLGFRAGRDVVLRHLEGLRAAGVHHVGLNFKYAARPAEEVLERVGREILPRLESSHPTESGAGSLF
jgi:luciferase-type oxidoreductase